MKRWKWVFNKYQTTKYIYLSKTRGDLVVLLEEKNEIVSLNLY